MSGCSALRPCHGLAAERLSASTSINEALCAYLSSRTACSVTYCEATAFPPALRWDVTPAVFNESQQHAAAAKQNKSSTAASAGKKMAREGIVHQEDGLSCFTPIKGMLRVCYPNQCKNRSRNKEQVAKTTTEPDVNVTWSNKMPLQINVCGSVPAGCAGMVCHCMLRS